MAELQCWAVEAGTEPNCSHITNSKPPGSTSIQHPYVCSSKAEFGLIKSCLLPRMPKLIILSAATKFPTKVTVLPPTPTLHLPKGSISEETKSKLMLVILFA